MHAHPSHAYHFHLVPIRAIVGNDMHCGGCVVLGNEIPPFLFSTNHFNKPTKAVMPNAFERLGLCVCMNARETRNHEDRNMRRQHQQHKHTHALAPLSRTHKHDLSEYGDGVRCERKTVGAALIHRMRRRAHSHHTKLTPFLIETHHDD